MKAFEIKVNGKLYDYRLGADLNLKQVKKFFEKKGYLVKKIWQEKRHVVAILKKNGREQFLKLSPTEGISATTQIDYNWNREANLYLKGNPKLAVPKNYDRGFYNDLFYLIEEYFKGDLLAKRPAPGSKNDGYKQHIAQMIEMSEIIQSLAIEPLSQRDNDDHAKYFMEKVESWYNEIPLEIQKIYDTAEMLQVVEKGYKNLEMRPRHGDFTPWHMIKLQNGRIGLIDGEHAMRNGVEYYDIAYLIQRVYSPMDDADFANEILNILKSRNYDLDKLTTVLAARAIGGFCDEVLIFGTPNFDRANKFKNWVTDL